ncbi:platelet-activating factor acetylhydrolase-like protein [Skeletonema marinoi]|uniref:1-alkyl-2-acetylglycerophosphocholine esterase n=1 Tax=Skeletonema marinoi TaxID=267567 RepID=A0AAD8YBF0_9STRA|nr:platelet-activating factor acetylhydrolase-like protein [Skeletonema marinoi]
MKVTPLFHSPHRLLVGDAPLVGVLDLPSSASNHERPPIRLFFPATTVSPKPRRVKQARYFVNNRVSYVLQGFAHIALARHTTKLYRFIVRPLMWMVSLFFPVRFLKIPDTALVTTKKDDSPVRYAPLNNNSNKTKSQSLIMFSHGLTGTGEENALFCTALAKRGYVVACIHHRDGSSSRVPMPDGTCKFYEHLPNGDDYSPNHRLEQVSFRAKEFLYATKWLLGEEQGGDDYDHPILQQIRPKLDTKKVVASGFSYGSTTCALAATAQPNRFQCAVFLDGWFHVDYSSKGYLYNFPPEAFGEDWPNGANNGNERSHVIENKEGLTIPSIFINSAQFEGYEKLYAATTTLANNINSHNKHDSTIPESKLHVIPNTKHQNFCDVGFWLPKVLLRRLGKLLALGDADVLEASENILDLTLKFLKQF